MESELERCGITVISSERPHKPMKGLKEEDNAAKFDAFSFYRFDASKDPKELTSALEAVLEDIGVQRKRRGKDYLIFFGLRPFDSQFPGSYIIWGLEIIGTLNALSEKYAKSDAARSNYAAVLRDLAFGRYWYTFGPKDSTLEYVDDEDDGEPDTSGPKSLPPQPPT